MDRIFAAIIGIPLGFVIMIFRYHIKQFTGPIAWAEQYMGSGGTYNLYIVVGLLISIVSLMYALGSIQDVVGATLGPFFGVGQH